MPEIYRHGDREVDILRKLVTNQAALPAAPGDRVVDLMRKLLLNQVNGGAVGSGLPAGGSTGQALAKLSPADYDVGWVTISGSGSGGNSYFPGGW